MPIIKWAGGKTQLLADLKERMPKRYSTYVEPFVGSGALFFDIAPQKAIINDSNPELINMYIQLRDRPAEMMALLQLYQEEYNSLDSGQNTYYYKKREEFNENILSEHLDVRDAALLVFLNKTCYNGLYRVNASGKFNTPWGKRKRVNLVDDNISHYSSLLQNASIMLGDFEESCINLDSGSFVYFDSPYYDTFDTYQAGGFPEEDHIRLATLFRNLTRKGIFCMLSNSNTDFIKEMYKEYAIDVVEVKRMINCNGSKRTGTEVIICNY